MIRLTTLALLVACGGDAASSGVRATAPLDPTTRDSAGVTIHEHPADALEHAPLITMDSVPMAVFAGSVESVEGDVSALSQFSFTGTGELVAFDGQASQVVVLSPTGERRTFGRAGAGPGELGRHGALIVMRGDTLLFNDGANNRVSLISASGGMLGELSLAGRTVRGVSQPIGRDASGSFYFQHWGFPTGGAESSGPLRQPVSVQGWGGGTDSVTDRFSAGEMLLWREVRTEGRNVTVMVRGASLTVEPQIRIWGDGILTASATRWMLEQRDSVGNLLQAVRIDRPALALTESVWSQYVDTMLARRFSRDSTIDRSAVREQIAAEEHTDSLPVFSRVVVTPNQTAWTLDYRLLGDTGWAATAFDLRGRILGRIIEPSGDPPVAFGDDRLAFRTEDEDGIATITIRKLNLP